MYKWISFPDLIDYQVGLNNMESALEKVINNIDPGYIMLMEHNPIYTAGTSASEEDLIDKKNSLLSTQGEVGVLPIMVRVKE